MATIVDTCNAGLSHLGNARRVTSIDPPDGSVEAGLCATFYPMALAEMLESADWSFARKRRALTELTTNDSAVWAYTYAQPADMVKPRRVLSDAAVALDQEGVPYDIEGDVLYTNQPAAVLLYTYAVSNSTKHTPTFNTALGYLLASYLAGPVIKGDEGAKAGFSLRKTAMNIANGAMSADANRSQLPLQSQPSGLLARSGAVGSVSPVTTGYTYGTGYAVN